MDGKRTDQPVSAWGVATLEGNDEVRVVAVKGELIGYDVSG